MGANMTHVNPMDQFPVYPWAGNENEQLIERIVSLLPAAEKPLLQLILVSLDARDRLVRVIRLVGPNPRLPVSPEESPPRRSA